MAKRIPQCRQVLQNDEYYCPNAHCGLRWSVNEERPPGCPRTLPFDEAYKKLVTK